MGSPEPEDAATTRQPCQPISVPSESSSLVLVGVEFGKSTLAGIDRCPVDAATPHKNLTGGKRRTGRPPTSPIRDNFSFIKAQGHTDRFHHAKKLNVLGLDEGYMKT